MKSQKTTQTMKPSTAAKKLGVHLQATPAEFQEGVVSRDELNALQAAPPEWLRELRLNGPHLRDVAAAKLGVSIAGLARGGITEPLTTAQIAELKADPPEWLQHEREVQAEFRMEAVRTEQNKLPKPPRKPSRKHPEVGQRTDGTSRRGRGNNDRINGDRRGRDSGDRRGRG